MPSAVAHDMVSSAAPPVRIAPADSTEEREADRVADAVLRGTGSAAGANNAPGPPTIYRQCAACAVGGPPCTSCDEDNAATTLHLKRSSDAPATPGAAAKAAGAIAGGGSPLPHVTRAYFEPRFGTDLSRVRVHTDAAAGAAAAGIDALAYALGDHIAFSPGQFAPGTVDGQQLVAHELAHVVRSEGTRNLIRRRPDNRKRNAGQAVNSDHDIQGEEAREATIVPGSALEKQLNRLNRQMEEMLTQIFGERPGDSDIFESDLPEDRKKPAKRAVSRYRRVTRILESLPNLDTAYAAQWLDTLMRTIRALLAVIGEFAKSSEIGRIFAESNKPILRGMLRRARRLRSQERMQRGSELASMASEAAALAASTSKRGADLPKIVSRFQLMTVGMSDVEIDIEIDRLRQRKLDELDRSMREEIDARIEGLQLGKTEGLRREFSDTPVVAVNDRLHTAQVQDRSRSGEIVAQMDSFDLQRAAETAEGQTRMGALGMSLAESTSTEGAIEYGASLLPSAIGEGVVNLAVGSANEQVELGTLVSGRVQDEKALAKLSRALVLSGHPATPIRVPDKNLSHFKVENSGNRVVLRKSDFLRGVEASDPRRTGPDRPHVWTFAPTDIVMLIDPMSGEAVKVPAFALLHIKDKAFGDTVKTWAAFLEIGVAVTKGLVSATKAELRGAGALDDATAGLAGRLDASETLAARTGEITTTAGKRTFGVRGNVLTICRNPCDSLIEKLDEMAKVLPSGHTKEDIRRLIEHAKKTEDALRNGLITSKEAGATARKIARLMEGIQEALPEIRELIPLDAEVLRAKRLAMRDRLKQIRRSEGRGTRPPSKASANSGAGDIDGTDWSHINKELEMDALGTTKIRSTGDAVREAERAGLSGSNAKPGSTDLGVLAYRQGKIVRTAFKVTGKDLEAAHIGPTALLRRVINYSRGAAKTVLLDPATHRKFDEHWKKWAVERRHNGDTHCSAGDLYDEMLSAINQIPAIPERTKKAIAWRLHLELFRDLGLSPSTILELPFSKSKPTGK